jgi:hypothetical protein
VSNNYQSGVFDSHIAGRLALPETVSVAVEEIAADMQEGLLALAVGTGLQVMAQLMEADVAAVCGPKGKHNPGREACAVPKLERGRWPGVLLVSSGRSCVLVDQSAQDSAASDRGVEEDHGGRIVVGRVLIETLMRPVVVEMIHVPVKDSAGVSLVVDRQFVGAFVADAANEPFCEAVCLRRPGRDLDDVDAFGGEDRIEFIGELGVPVTDQETERGNPLAEVHQEIPGGLDGPGCSRMSSDAEDVDSSSAYFHHE